MIFLFKLVPASVDELGNNKQPSKIDEDVETNLLLLGEWRQRRKLMMATLDLTEGQLQDLDLELESTCDFFARMKNDQK
jgi:hypothetical protein